MFCSKNDWLPKDGAKKIQKRDAIKESNGMRNAISWRFMGKLISSGSFAPSPLISQEFLCDRVVENDCKNVTKNSGKKIASSCY